MVSPVGAFGGLGLDVPQAAREGDLGQEDFLNLMLTQLKNQDPFKPMESGEFLGQLAQFGTVQGLAGLQTSFDSLASSLVSNQALQAASLVGRSALAATDTVGIVAGQTVSGAIDLPTATASVTLVISDSTGQPVRTMQLGAQPEGLVPFSWNGLDEDGEAVPPGRYTFGAAYFSGTDAVVADTLLRAPIDSVLLGKDGFNVELRGIGELPFSAVREFRNELVATTEAPAAEPAADADEDTTD
jgi:flagellar basal-body rod modification protein FlgD